MEEEEHGSEEKHEQKKKIEVVEHEEKGEELEEGTVEGGGELRGTWRRGEGKRGGPANSDRLFRSSNKINLHQETTPTQKVGSRRESVGNISWNTVA